MKFKHFIVAILFTLFSIQFLKAETFKAGSYIINMGITPQTYDNGLKPYGMVYDMVINKEVPLYWIIKTGKSLYGTDFTYDTIEYKAGSLVLPEVYVTPEVVTAINAWRAEGIVIYGPTATDFDAPAYNYISSFPNAVVDSDNHALTDDLFYNHTSIPSTYYTSGTPNNINACCDVYALPHADPQDWNASTIAKYIAYTDSKSQSFLWQGCHSVGAVESTGTSKNGNPYLGLEMLTTKGQIAWENDLPFSNVNGPPFEYNTNMGDNPIMQIASPLSSNDNSAFDSGSQRIYIPRPDSDWRTSTTVAIWDPDNINTTGGTAGGGGKNKNTSTIPQNNKKAALLAFGRTYGDPENGILLQQASHDARIKDPQNAEEISMNVSSARVYGNLLLQASIEKRPIVTIDAPNSLYYGNDYNMSATVARGAAPFDFEWDITCPGSNDPGTFLDPVTKLPSNTQEDVNESNIIFRPNNNTLDNCILRVKVTDFCGRKNFATKILGITGYQPSLGTYNVTHSGVVFPDGKDPLITVDPLNSLYTQISGKSFNVTLVALQENKETLDVNKNGNVILELIETAGVTEHDPESCAKASVVFQGDVTSKIDTGDNGGHFSNGATVSAIGISYSKAIQEIGFRVSYYELPLEDANDEYSFGIPDSIDKAELDNRFASCASSCSASPQTDWDCYACIAKSSYLGGHGTAVCARDNFSVRPASFDLDLTGAAPFIGGQTYPLQLNAVTFGGGIDTWYTESLDDVGSLFAPTQEANLSSVLSIPTGCSLTSGTSPLWSGGTIEFIAGEGKLQGGSPILFNYDNVGDINITAVENKWVAYTDMDKAFGNILYSDCIEGSSSNIPLNGKIGCMIEGIYGVTFIPLGFINTLRLNDSNTDTNFTYIANSEGTDPEYGADMTLTYTAVLNDNTTTATNYTAGCYANDITTTISLTNNTVLGWEDTQGRIWMYDSNTTTDPKLIDSQNAAPPEFTFTYPETHFSAGTTTRQVLFNLDREQDTPDNPTSILYSDFGLTVADTVDTSVTGSDFNRTAGNSNESDVTFYYARTRPAKFFYEDITTSSVATPVAIDIYCDLPTATCSSRGIDTVLGAIHVSDWYLSTGHRASLGDGDVTLQIGTIIEGAGSPQINLSNTSNIQIESGGINSNVSISLNGSAVPLTVLMDFVEDGDILAPPSVNKWLIYNKDDPTLTPSPFYKVRFIGGSEWTGEGETGYIIDTDASYKKIKRLDW